MLLFLPFFLFWGWGVAWFEKCNRNYYNSTRCHVVVCHIHTVTLFFCAYGA